MQGRVMEAMAVYQPVLKESVATLLKFAVLPIGKVLVMCALGLLLATKSVNILPATSRRQLSKVYLPFPFNSSLCVSLLLHLHLFSTRSEQRQFQNLKNLFLFYFSMSWPLYRRIINWCYLFWFPSVCYFLNQWPTDLCLRCANVRLILFFFSGDLPHTHTGGDKQGSPPSSLRREHLNQWLLRSTLITES